VTRRGLHPRTVAAWSAAAIAVIILANNPVYRALVALVALNLLVAQRRPGTSLRTIIGFLSVFALFTMAYNPLISHGGAHQLARLPEFLPGIGGAVTLESIVFGAAAAVGFLAAALAVTPLALVLDPTELLEAMPVAMHGTATALSAALNLVPTIGRSFRRVREAESLRGGGRRGPLSLLDVVVPVALTTIESSITLAEAMEARGYGSGPRTHFRDASFELADCAVIAAALGAVLVLLAARLAGTPLDWYPFPTVALPTVSPVAVAGCLLLAAPVLLPVAGPARARAAGPA
jgi:energy-coupling factor transport system permease protein